MSDHSSHVTDGLLPPLRKGAENVTAHQAPGYHVGMKNARHLFVLAPGILESTSPEEVEATKVGLQEVGLWHMPYDRDVYVQISAREVVGSDADPGHNIVYGPFGRDQTVRLAVYREGHELASDASDPFPEVIDLLIVLLATKNAEKKTTTSGMAKLGIGKKRFVSTTTITIGRELPIDRDNPPRGGTVAAHLRRGHIRLQHYGKENRLEKKIWIASTFVNADPDFVATRTKYRIAQTRDVR